MTAETLRRAAALMRDRAEGSRSWWPSDDHDGMDEAPWMDREWWSSVGLSSDAAEHAASWHPVVALAVAAVIDHMAEVQEADEADGTFGNEDCECPWCQGLPLILHLARAYLGESS